MKKIIEITKEYIETLLSLHVTEIENSEESAEEFFNTLAPSMAGTSYTPSSILKYFNCLITKLPQKTRTKNFLILGPCYICKFFTVNYAYKTHPL